MDIVHLPKLLSQFCKHLSSESNTRKSHLKPSEYQVPDRLRERLGFGRIPAKINVSYFGSLARRTWSHSARCDSITCTDYMGQGLGATFCFKKTTPEYYFQDGKHPEIKGRIL